MTDLSQLYFLLVSFYTTPFVLHQECSCWEEHNHQFNLHLYNIILKCDWNRKKLISLENDHDEFWRRSIRSQTEKCTLLPATMSWSKNKSLILVGELCISDAINTDIIYLATTPCTDCIKVVKSSIASNFRWLYKTKLMSYLPNKHRPL